MNQMNFCQLQVPTAVTVTSAKSYLLRADAVHFGGNIVCFLLA
jgi:hypothetical protein